MYYGDKFNREQLISYNQHVVENTTLEERTVVGYFYDYLEDGELFISVIVDFRDKYPDEVLKNTTLEESINGGGKRDAIFVENIEEYFKSLHI